MAQQANNGANQAGAQGGAQGSALAVAMDWSNREAADTVINGDLVKKEQTQEEKNQQIIDAAFNANPLYRELVADLIVGEELEEMLKNRQKQKDTTFDDRITKVKDMGIKYHRDLAVAHGNLGLKSFKSMPPPVVLQIFCDVHGVSPETFAPHEDMLTAAGDFQRQASQWFQYYTPLTDADLHKEMWKSRGKVALASDIDMTPEELANAGITEDDRHRTLICTKDKVLTYHLMAADDWTLKDQAVSIAATCTSKKLKMTDLNIRSLFIDKYMPLNKAKDSFVPIYIYSMVGPNRGKIQHDPADVSISAYANISWEWSAYPLQVYIVL
jgi:hypothetical protein